MASAVRDAYDERNLQTKALERWERQRKAWEGMRRHLLEKTDRGSARHGGARNFSLAVSRERTKAEDLGMVNASVPQYALSSNFTWESMLRRTVNEGAMRYVQIGKGYFPYALFGEVRDPAAVKADHPVFTRVVSESCNDDGESMDEFTAQRTVALRILRHMTLTSGQRAAIGAVTGDVLGDEETADPPLSIRSNYYLQQMRQFLPYVEKKFAHFLLPRAFLQVEGRPAPRLLRDGGEEEALVGELERSHPPVHFVPPPQTVRLSCTNESTSPTSCSTANVCDASTASGAIPHDRVRRGVKFSEHASVSDQPGVCDDATSAKRAEGNGSTKTSSPMLDISTRRLLFRSQPGELVHHAIVIRNTGSVTVYFNWAHVNLLEEQQEEDQTATGILTSGSVGSGSVDNAGHSLSHIHIRLHAMAVHNKASRPYFSFSSGVNGVLLPGTEQRFPFSFRAPRAGRFKQTVELLTIPPSPERLLVELSSIVGTSHTSPGRLGQSVEEAFRAKAASDGHRHFIQKLARTPLPYEAADLDRAIGSVRQAKLMDEARQSATVESQRKRWQQENGATFDDIPYNQAVYTALERLQGNYMEIMEQLQRPPAHNHWDGSLEQLLSDLMDLRDASSRTVLYEALLVLLRAARVSQDESEGLEVLLDRAVAATISQLENRSCLMQEREAMLLQMQREPILPATAAVAKKRPTSGGSRKQSANGNYSRSRGSAEKTTTAAAGTTRSAFEFSLSQDDTRHQEEYDVLVHQRKKAVMNERKKLTQSCKRAFQRAIDAGCHLPMLSVVQARRAGEVSTNQMIDVIDVDVNADTATSKLIKRR